LGIYPDAFLVELLAWGFIPKHFYSIGTISMLTEQLKKDIHGELTDASVKIFEKVNQNDEFRGTGFFITPDGYLLTAYHCVKDAPKDILVETDFDGKFEAVLDQEKSLRASKYDIAVLKIDYQPTHYLPLGFVADKHKGDQLVTTGYPAGDIADNQEIGIYFGTISRFRGNKIEMDAAKGPGHSGGPVYHYGAQCVVGLVTEGYKPNVMLNTGLATRFEPLFKKWREFKQINQAVAQAWIKRLQNKPPPEKPLLPKKTLPKKPLSQLEPCRGAMPLDSKFYVERQVDNDFQTTIQRRDSIVLLKGPRQVGKTSLLARGLQQAREAGVRVLLTDFQKLVEPQLQSSESFFLAIAQMLARQLRLKISPQQSWSRDYTASGNFENYFLDEILATSEEPVLWAIDEADHLFDYPFSSEIFALLRTWHNERALNPDSPCSRLTLAIAYATESYLFIKEQNQSPFNVGTKFVLEDFTLEHIVDLNQRYGIPLKNNKEIKQFHQLVGGQPYLVRCGLNDMVSYQLTLNEFIRKAAHDDGTYGEHLHRIVMLLNREQALSEVMQQVLRGEPCPDYESFYRLRSFGILKGESKDNVSLRCKIYEHFLKKHLL
jgi:hypothetical protein